MMRSSSPVRRPSSPLRRPLSPAERKGRSSLRYPPHNQQNGTNKASPSFLSCFIGESQSTKRSVMQTHLLGMNCYCLKANCSGIVHVVEMDRVLTSPCFDFPIYSLETRRIVKCNKCFYVSSLQAHRLNSIGKGKLPVVKLARAAAANANDESKSATCDSTKATRGGVGYVNKTSTVDHRKRADDKQSTSSSSIYSKTSTGNPRGASITSSSRISSTGDNPNTNTSYSDNKKHVSIVDGHKVIHHQGGGSKGNDVYQIVGVNDHARDNSFPPLDNNEKDEPYPKPTDEDSAEAAAHIAQLIEAIKATGAEDEALQIASLIRKIQAQGDWFGGGKTSSPREPDGGRASQARESRDLSYDQLVGGREMLAVDDDRVEPPEWLFVKSKDEGDVSTDISGLHSTLKIQNDPPIQSSTTTSRRSGEIRRIPIARVASPHRGLDPPNPASEASGSEASGISEVRATISRKSKRSGHSRVTPHEASPVSRRSGQSRVVPIDASPMSRSGQTRFSASQVSRKTKSSSPARGGFSSSRALSQKSRSGESSDSQVSHAQPNRSVSSSSKLGGSISREASHGHPNRSESSSSRRRGEKSLASQELAGPSDLIQYIARAKNAETKTRDPPQRNRMSAPADNEPNATRNTTGSGIGSSDPPVYAAQRVSRAQQEPGGTKAKYKDPKGRRRRSTPSRSSNLTNPNRKHIKEAGHDVHRDPEEAHQPEHYHVTCVVEDSRDDAPAGRAPELYSARGRVEADQQEHVYHGHPPQIVEQDNGGVDQVYPGHSHGHGTLDVGRNHTQVHYQQLSPTIRVAGNEAALVRKPEPSPANAAGVGDGHDSTTIRQTGHYKAQPAQHPSQGYPRAGQNSEVRDGDGGLQACLSDYDPRSTTTVLSPGMLRADEIDQGLMRVADEVDRSMRRVSDEIDRSSRAASAEGIQRMVDELDPYEAAYPVTPDTGRLRPVLPSPRSIPAMSTPIPLRARNHERERSRSRSRQRNNASPHVAIDYRRERSQSRERSQGPYIPSNYQTERSRSRQRSPHVDTYNQRERSHSRQRSLHVATNGQRERPHSRQSSRGRSEVPSDIAMAHGANDLFSLPAVQAPDKHLATADLPKHEEVDKSVDDIIKETVTVMRSSIPRSATAIAPVMPELPRKKKIRRRKAEKRVPEVPLVTIKREMYPNAYFQDITVPRDE
ncbi:expressed unknown protein [Seminavis robusta]|uniref:Uncharacterized protein n=1 Tax=Seminavis robusta TaxID=568900 RepID=A0A9N8DLK1_9STRA|nr:expressed unknown protein [Seminavis robusta]|eukprot:Sro191_g082310.1 n/a (1180) ;mRNA; r:63300-67267